MFNPDVHHRRSVRLKGHDYSIGSYFITMSTNQRLPLFGQIVDNQMIRNDAGNVVEQIWMEVCQKFPNTVLDAYVVMPEHFHAIIDLGVTSRSEFGLSHIIQYFKSQTTIHYIQGVRESHWQGFYERLWQRNYYEHTIRNEAELIEIRNYIKSNPVSYHRTMVEDFYFF